MDINIFPQEVSDGLEASIKNNSIAFLSQVIQKEVDDAVLQEAIKASAEANPYQYDLFYLESVLASTGWNNNDDVFDVMELWASRLSPVDKPFNFMHQEEDIIGHITSSRVVNAEGQVITNLPIPDKFDVVVGSVLYKHWEDKDRKERINGLIDGIVKGEWFVSMECLFPHFDYALISPDSSHKVIARNEESSYLTKYLRIYGGPGSYQGYKLGRLLRNFTFSGKGLVNKPANPRSYILTFSKDCEPNVFQTAAQIIEAQEIIMPDITYTKEQYEAIVGEHAKATTLVNETNSKLEAALKQVDLLTKSEASIKSVLEETTKAKDTQIEELKAKLAKADEAFAKTEEEMKKMKEAKCKAERLGKLKARKIEDAKAEELVNKFLSVSDELFDEVVSAYPLREQTVETTTVDTVTTADNLNKTESKDLNLAVATENNNTDARTKAVEWFSSLGKKKK